MVEEKKTLLDKAIDAVSNRDEKAAAAAAVAAKAKAEADKKTAAMRAKLAADKAKAEMNAKTAARAAEHKALVEKAATEKAAAEKAAKLQKHVVKEGETWTHIALKYYGRSIEPFWRLIYEANKGLVGDDYRRLRPGMEIVIPELTEELKNMKIVR